MTEKIPRRLLDLAYPRARETLKYRREAIQRFIVGPYAPAAPFISDDMTVACIGSCFAEEMAKHLTMQGRRVAPIFLSERWNTAFAVRCFVENVLDGTPFPDGFLGGLNIDPVIQSFEHFASADAFIVTFGLSVCWYDRLPGAWFSIFAMGTVKKV